MRPLLVVEWRGPALEHLRAMVESRCQVLSDRDRWKGSAVQCELRTLLLYRAACSSLIFFMRFLGWATSGGRGGGVPGDDDLGPSWIWRSGARLGGRPVGRMAEWPVRWLCRWWRGLSSRRCRHGGVRSGGRGEDDRAGAAVLLGGGVVGRPGRGRSWPGGLGLVTLGDGCFGVNVQVATVTVPFR